MAAAIKGHVGAAEDGRRRLLLDALPLRPSLSTQGDGSEDKQGFIMRLGFLI
jgi:hypothetical protein